MSPSSTREAAASLERASAGRGSRMLTDWLLDCLAVYGSKVERTEDGGWSVDVGEPLVPVLGREHLELVPAREAGHGNGNGKEPVSWESELCQSLIAYVRDRGQVAELWLGGVGPEEGLRIVEARLEVEGAAPRLTAGAIRMRPLLAYNFKVRWQGTEGREELRSVTFDPGTGLARETPPSDQEHFVAPPPAKRPAGRASLPIREGFEQARQVLEAALAEKLDQRNRKARATKQGEEARLNAYYSQLLKDESHASPRRGEKRARERAEQLKREWRQKLEALSGTVEEARYGLVSASVLWTPWLDVEVTLGSRPRIARTTQVDLHLKRWEGLVCDACGRPHTWFRREGGRLVGRDCPVANDD